MPSSVAGGAASGPDEVTLRGYGSGLAPAQAAERRDVALEISRARPTQCAMSSAPPPARPSLPAGPGLGGRNAGQALMEPLVALALLGIAVSPMVGAVEFLVATTARADHAIAIDAVAADAAARLAATGVNDCIDQAERNAASAAAVAVGWPQSSVSITSSARAERVDERSWTWITDDCAAGSPRIHLIDVEVHSPDGRASTRREVVVVGPPEP